MVYRCVKGGEYQTVANISNKSQNFYTDKNVVKGKSYTYKVRAFASYEDSWVFGSYSQIKTIKVSTSLLKPVVSSTKKGKKLTLVFDKVEGTNYESQYRYIGDTKWTELSSLSGKLTSKVTKKIKANNFQIRIRTYMKVSGKKYYSQWSKSITVK